MEYQKQLSRWLERAREDSDLITELNEVKDDPSAVSDRFYRDLAFGPGGLQGIIGAGTNRMNIYTVRRATQGLADYCNTVCINIFLEHLSSEYTDDYIVLVCDGAAWHRSGALKTFPNAV